jgi:hypothetical protein
MGLRRAWWIVVLMALLGSRTSGLAALPCNHLTNPPGAVYLYPDTPTTATFFTGNAFEIIGWDATLGDEPGPAPAIFGLATRNEANAQAVRDELNVGQMDNIIGKDFVYFPVRSSIGVMAGPDTTAIDAFVESLLAGPHVSVTPGTIAENTTLGDVANPVVAHLTGQGAGVTIATDVHVSGAGVLVVDDALTVQGRLDYDGLVIVRGPVIEKYIAIIHGSLWAADVALAVGGACLVQYSSEALGLAVQAAGTACTSPKCGDGIRTDDEACDGQHPRRRLLLGDLHARADRNRLRRRRRMHERRHLLGRRVHRCGARRVRPVHALRRDARLHRSAGIRVPLSREVTAHAAADRHAVAVAPRLALAEWPGDDAARPGLSRSRRLDLLSLRRPERRRPALPLAPATLRNVRPARLLAVCRPRSPLRRPAAHDGHRTGEDPGQPRRQDLDSRPRRRRVARPRDVPRRTAGDGRAP